MHTCVHAYIHRYAHACIRTYTYIPTYIHTGIHTYTHTYIHTYIDIYTHTSTHAYKHTCTHGLPNIHTFIHACAHACIYALSMLSTRICTHSHHIHANVNNRTRLQKYSHTDYISVSMRLYELEVYLWLRLSACNPMPEGDMQEGSIPIKHTHHILLQPRIHFFS